MLKVIQEKEDETKLLHLIPRIRTGDCSVSEAWFVHYCIRMGRGLSSEVRQLLGEVPAEGGTPTETWLKGLAAYYQCGDEERIVKILEGCKDSLCLALLGLVYMKRDQDTDHEISVVMFERSAAGGCAEGLFGLGIAYAGGLGVDMDYMRGLEMIRRAADMGYPEAMTRIGVWLAHGKSSAHGLGVKYLERGATHGDAEACRLLGTFYEHGHAVKQDRRRAASLYRKAIILGDYFGFEALKNLPKEDTIPWGEWYPDPLMHKYVPNEMRHQIRTMLLIRARQGTLLSQLPKQLVLDICSWICTHPPEAPKDNLGAMDLQRQIHDLGHQLKRQQQMLETILSKIS